MPKSPIKLKRKLSFSNEEPAFKSPTPKKKKTSISDDVDTSQTAADISITSPSPQKSKLSISGFINTAEQEFSAEHEVKEETVSEDGDHHFVSLQSPKKSGPQPMTIIHTPLRSAEKKRRKQASESAESTNGRVDSDAANSSQSESSAKKKSKKDKVKNIVEPPPPKPPSAIEDYFKLHIFTGKPRKAQKAFNKLTKKERKHLQIEYNDKVESYVKHLKLFLASLPRDEAVAYVSRILMIGNPFFYTFLKIEVSLN